MLQKELVVAERKILITWNLVHLNPGHLDPGAALVPGQIQRDDLRLLRPPETTIHHHLK